MSEDTDMLAIIEEEPGQYNIDDYQADISEFAIYPDAHTGHITELMYLALGTNDEAGEIAGKIKKLYRDTSVGDVQDLSEEQVSSIAKELGDVLWYITRLADEIGYDMSEIALMNYYKLSGRSERGTLGGSGDNR